MFLKLGDCELSFVAILLEICQQLFWEVYEAELGKFLAKIGHLLKAVVIGELAQTFEANLAKYSEFVLDVEICCSHVKVGLNDAIE